MLSIGGGGSGSVKKPSGFMSSSEYILDELDRKCPGGYDHVPLIAGRAAGAAIRFCRGVAWQKKHDQGSMVTPGRMTYMGLRSFVRHVCDLQVSSSKAIEQILTTNMQDGTHRPTGDYPHHLMDYWHEEDGGDDHRGVRPQVGVTMLQREMDGLTFKGGYEVAWDDVTNAELLSDLVKKAHKVEMGYFAELDVCEYATRAQQEQTLGKIIGVRWVDVNKGDSKEPESRSRLVGREFALGKDNALYAATPPLEALRRQGHCHARFVGRGRKR